MNSGRLLFLIGIIALTACTSGKKAFEHGNYVEAVMQSVGRLRQKPDHSKSQEALKNSYPMAMNTCTNVWVTCKPHLII